MEKDNDLFRDQQEPEEVRPEDEPKIDEPVGQDGPIAQGDARFSDVPEDISPGDEFVLVNPETGDMVDLSDIEEMEDYASIADTGGLPIIVDSDVEGIAGYTEDEDILDDFSERQQLGGTDRLIEQLGDYTQLSPEISGNDVDAAWIYADQAGEEGVGGSVPTPDQDVVEELGEALGIVYNDGEPLATEEKLDARDQQRWELDPASQDDRDDDAGDIEDIDDSDAYLDDEEE